MDRTCPMLRRLSRNTKPFQLISCPGQCEVNQLKAQLRRQLFEVWLLLYREARFKDLEKMMAYIEDEKYHDADRATDQGRQVLKKWTQLSDLLTRHQQKLELDNEMLSHLRDIETVHFSVKNLHKSFNSEEFQKASKIEDSMQRLNLFESEINAISDSIRR